MSDAQLGLWLMLGSATTAGIVFGFQFSKNESDSRIPNLIFIALFAYYVGAVIYQPAITVMYPNFTSGLYAVETAFVGLVVVAIVSLVVNGIFRLFEPTIMWQIGFLLMFAITGIIFEVVPSGLKALMIVTTLWIIFILCEKRYSKPSLE